MYVRMEVCHDDAFSLLSCMLLVVAYLSVQEQVLALYSVIVTQGWQVGCAFEDLLWVEVNCQLSW